MKKYQYMYQKSCDNCNHKFSPEQDKMTEDTQEIDMPPYYKTYVLLICSQCGAEHILNETSHLEHD